MVAGSAEGQDFFKLGGVEHSPDHKLLAYSTDVKGSRPLPIWHPKP